METTTRKLPQLTDWLPLGRSGLQVSPLCLGSTGGNPDVVEAAFDAGINFFFVSGDLHWIFYESLRRGLASLLARRPSVREQIVVAGCSYVSNPVFVSGTQHEILKSVPGLEYIDVLTVGGAYSSDFLPRLHHAERFRRGGVVRSLAVSVHDRALAVTAHNHELVDAVFSRYNPVHPGARHDLFPLLTPSSSTLLYNFKSTQGFVNRRRFAELGLSDDHWQPEPTDYYRFALTQSALDGILCGLTTVEHVAALDAALQLGPLDDEEQQYLCDLVQLDAGAELEPGPAPPSSSSSESSG